MKLCYMDCGKCTVSVLKELPCGHQLSLPCFVDTITFPCNEKVRFITNTTFVIIIKTIFKIIGGNGFGRMWS